MTNDYFSKQAVGNMKGLFAIMVLVHHIFMKVLILPEGIVAEFITHHFGYWAVSAFFFFSGYGLTISSGKDGYKEHFLRNRVLPIFLINAALIAVYTLEKLLLNIPINSAKIINSFLIGETVVNFGWFMQIIVIFYLLFWISSYFTKRSADVLTLLILIYVSTCMALHLSDCYYLSSLAFPLGVYFCKYKNKVDNVCKNIQMTLLFITGLVFATTMAILYRLHTGSHALGFAILPLYFLEGPLLMCFIVMLLKLFSINSKLLTFCGSISFAIYVMQGFVYNLLRNGFWNIDNMFISAILWFVGTFLIAYLTQPLLNLIMRKVRA